MRGTSFLSLLLILLPLGAQTEWKFAGLSNLPGFCGNYVNGKAAKAAFRMDPSVVTPAGKGALEIAILQSSATSNGSDIQIWLTQDKGLTPGKKYRLRLVMKASEAVQNALSLQFIKNGAPYSAASKPGGARISVGTDWKEQAFDLEALPAAEGVSLRFPDFFCGEIKAGTRLYLASASLVAAP
ncbi:MAG: hypothetical protein J0L75_19455 [Spirochaetes bacterium]|nr:hypothetical protein [Spirochaetota bacterium]